MKVLFLAYPQVGLNIGGFEIQIQKTAESLAQLGVDIIFYNPWENQINDVDICHLFSLDHSMYYHIKQAREQKKPIIMSPVFNGFASSAWLMKLKVLLAENIPGMLGTLVLSKFMLKSSNRVLALNSQEQELLIMAFGLEPPKCIVIPNGINKSFCTGDPKLFEEKYGVKDFVLEVGAVGERKNQLTLIRAMAELPYPLVIVGGPDGGDSSYLNKCRETAHKKIIFTGHLSNDDPLLASAYAAAKLFVLPSYSEVMPLALYEAALAGCKLIVSKNFPIAEELKTFIPKIDPDNVKNLAKTIDREMQTAADNKLISTVQKMPSWNDVGEKIKNVYSEVVQDDSP